MYITGTADHVSTPTSSVPSRRADPGTNDSPPPSDLASSLLERGGRRAPSSSSRGLAATPPECGDSHTLSSSLVQGDPKRAKSWDGAGGARGGGDIPIWPVGRHIWSRGATSIRTSLQTPGYFSFKDEDYDPEEEHGTTRREPYCEPAGRSSRWRSYSQPQDQIRDAEGKTQAWRRSEHGIRREQTYR